MTHLKKNNNNSPKMKSINIYSTSSCSKTVWNPFFCWTQKMILWRIWVT